MSRLKKSQRSKASLAALTLRPRRSRHGRIMVGNAPREFEDQRPSPFVKTWRTIEDDGTGVLVVKHHQRTMTADEVIEARNRVKRAVSATTEKGNQNMVTNAKPKAVKK